MAGEKNVIRIGESLNDALKLLNTSAQRVLLVVDPGEGLIGTLSDGDVRRALLSGHDLASPIDGNYNKNPFFFFEDEYSDMEARKKFLEKKYDLIPILDRERRIVRLVSWDSFFSDTKDIERSKEQICIPLVVMAGGKGTRMAPFTNVLPKPLIPIGGKTIIELILDEFRAYGVDKYFFTVNYRGEMIRAYFDGIETHYDINYLWEKDFCGTAGSLRLLGEKAPERFFVSNCDIIVKANYADFAKFHRESGACLTIVSSVQNMKVPYGVVRFQKGGKVSSIEEKPEYSFTINTGVYLLERRCLDYIPAGEIFHMTDLIDRLMVAGEPVYTYPINENEYMDIGQWEEYRKAIEVMRG